MKKDQAYTINDFDIIKDLGKGSFSTVKLVKRKEDGKLLALKEVSMDRLTINQKNLALNEVRLLASINSPFIISYHGSFFSNKSNSLCLLMEYAEEGDLQGIINLKAKQHKMKSGLPEEFIWRTIIQILQGLRTMHSNKMAHRDLKSANIFFSNEVAKLGDLNVSTVSDNCFYETKTGTPYYTAPEIWKGNVYTNKCDIWSLGCIIYEMCALLPPFKASSFPQLFNLISKGHYRPLPQDYSNQLRTLVRMCLNISASQRPSASQLLQNPLIVEKQISYKIMIGNKQNVRLIAEIKCPKRIRFINQILPKPQNREQQQQQEENFRSSLQKNHISLIQKPSNNNTKSLNKIRIKKQKTQKCITVTDHQDSGPSTHKKISQKSFRMISEPCIVDKKSDKSSKKTIKSSGKNFRLRSQKRIEKENLQ